MNKTNFFLALLSGALLLASCGNSGETKSSETKDSSASTTPAATTSSAADDKGLELIGSSDCTTCHRLHEADAGSAIGPSYEKVATKYSPAADTTVARIVKKIISGGQDNGNPPIPAGPSSSAGNSTPNLRVPATFSFGAHNGLRAHLISLALEPWWRRGLQNRRPGVRLLPGVRTGHPIRTTAP